MHRLFEQANGITRDVIGAAIEVHKDKGPGLLESAATTSKFKQVNDFGRE